MFLEREFQKKIMFFTWQKNKHVCNSYEKQILSGYIQTSVGPQCISYAL